MNKAVKSRCLAVRGDGNALLAPPKRGGCPTRAFLEISGFLQCVFRCVLTYILVCCAAGLWCMIGSSFLVCRSFQSWQSCLSSRLNAQPVDTLMILTSVFVKVVATSERL